MVPAFEGAEKTLIVDFCLQGKISSESGNGLLDIDQPVWDSMLTDCKCQILSVLRNKEITAYVLSESSLFVMRHKVILKTCGTTQTLNAVPHLLRIAKEMDSSIEFVHFYHTDFIAPMSQPFPHSSFQHEVLFLNKYFPAGKWLSYGPPQGHFGSKWHVFVADYTQKDAPQRPELTLEIHMSGLDPNVMRLFADNAGKKKFDLSRAAGIGELLPEFALDECFFEPCGYSMNALDSAKAYATIHITPEPECSYVSFETNAANIDLPQLTNAVLDKFRPQNATVVLFSDDKMLSGRIQAENVQMTSGSFSKFETAQVSTHHFIEGYTLSLIHLQRTDDLSVIRKSSLCSVDASHVMGKWLRIQPFVPEASPSFPMSSVGADNYASFGETRSVFTASSGPEMTAALAISPTFPLIVVNNCKTKTQLQLASTHSIPLTVHGLSDLTRIAKQCPTCPLIYDVGVLDHDQDMKTVLAAAQQIPEAKVTGLRVMIDETICSNTVAKPLALARDLFEEFGHKLNSVHVCFDKKARITPSLLLAIHQAILGVPLFVDCAAADETDGTF